MINYKEEITYWYKIEKMPISVIAEVYEFTPYRIKRFFANEPEFSGIPFLSLTASSNVYEDHEPALL